MRSSAEENASESNRLTSSATHLMRRPGRLEPVDPEKWYLVLRSKLYGPIARDTLAEVLAEHTSDDTTPLWSASHGEEWTTTGDLPLLVMEVRACRAARDAAEIGTDLMQLSSLVSSSRARGAASAPAVSGELDIAAALHAMSSLPPPPPPDALGALSLASAAALSIPPPPPRRASSRAAWGWLGGGVMLGGAVVAACFAVPLLGAGRTAALPGSGPALGSAQAPSVVALVQPVATPVPVAAPPIAIPIEGPIDGPTAAAPFARVDAITEDDDEDEDGEHHHHHRRHHRGDEELSADETEAAEEMAEASVEPAESPEEEEAPLVAAAPPAPAELAAPTTVAVPEARSEDRTIDDLIARALPSGVGSTHTTTEVAHVTREAPTDAEVVRALDRVRGELTACTPVHAVAALRLTLSGPTGRVNSVLVDGVFAGTPVGSCIARAVRHARVEPFSQPTVSLSYPYRL